jgi:hypothetical protein
VKTYSENKHCALLPALVAIRCLPTSKDRRSLEQDLDPEEARAIVDPDQNLMSYLKQGLAPAFVDELDRYAIEHPIGYVRGRP